MWPQNYSPVLDSVPLSALTAALPIFTLLYLLGVRRKASWIAGLWGLGAALVVALLVYRMPPALAGSAVLYGAAYALFPITWVIFWAIFLYRLTVETGQFEILKDSIARLTPDKRLQALLIAFAFGAFVEGAAGFGTPVAVAAGMMVGLGFSPFYASGICLLANTAPVAFGSLGTPVLMLAGVTGLPLHHLSAAVGRICAPVSLFVPAYLMLVMGGLKGLREVLTAALLCGAAFAGAQIIVSNFIGPQLTDILGSLASILALVVYLKLRHAGSGGAGGPGSMTVFRAWAPYGFLVLLVLLWGQVPIKKALDSITVAFGWPGLHQLIAQGPPVAKEGTQYAARYTFNLLSASGTAGLTACLLSALFLRVPLSLLGKVFRMTIHQLALPTLTVCSVIGLAFLMNYCGATATLGLAFSATGVIFPFFSALLGWLGVFLTGSDTSANALFGNLQVVTANRLEFNPILTAASNSSGGVMGKMISLQSIAVASAATGMPSSEESRLFRFTLKHSILLASIIGLVTLFYAYVKPEWMPK